jgi:hypothetical protein
MTYQCPICKKFLGDIYAYFNDLDEITRVTGICKQHGKQEVPRSHWDYSDFTKE